MRPHTWSKPKPLLSVAGKTVLDHLLGTFETLPSSLDVEYTFIISPFLGESQIPAFMTENYPKLKVNYAIQNEMKGQSHAILLAKKHLTGPIIVIYADTLINADFSAMPDQNVDIIGWVKTVPDPRRFGVAVVNSSGQVERLIEKPKDSIYNLAVVGCYYFREGRDLVSAIEKQIHHDKQLSGEYYLTDAINIMLNGGTKMETRQIDTWLDTGTIDATLETNRYLLEHGGANLSKPRNYENVEIIEPVFIHPSAEVSDSVIGPYASIGEECYIDNACIENSILDGGATVEFVSLKDSFIGKQSEVRGHSAKEAPLKLNVGDQSSVIME